MTDHALKPPFEIWQEIYINDRDGAVCKADSPEIAQALLALLNRTMIPVTPEKHGPTPERVLDWIEISLLRVRDSEKKLSASSVPVVRVLTQICEHLAAFRKEFKDHG